MAGFALGGFLVQAYLTPNVVVQAHRDAAGHVSADVEWKCVWDLVTVRRLHIEDFEGAETESLDHVRTMTDSNADSRNRTTIRLRLKSRTDSWLVQLAADDDDVWSSERRSTPSATASTVIRRTRRLSSPAGGPSAGWARG